MKKALLISISINGYYYDIINIANILITQYGYQPQNIICLCNDGIHIQPNYKNIINNLKYIVSQSNTYTQLWIYYGGHGRFDGIVSIDNKIISKEEIYNFIYNIKCQTFILFDCCYSSSFFDKIQWKYLYFENNIQRIRQNHWSLINTNIYIICSSNDNEKSADIYDIIDNIYQGAFTTAILNSFKYMSYNISLIDLYKNICNELQNMNISQTPIIYSTNSNIDILFKPSIQIKNNNKTIRNNFHSIKL